LAFLLVVSSLVGLRPALAQDTATRAADERAIREAGKAYLAALRQGDVKVLHECWTADGEYVDAMGEKVKARDLFAKRAEAADADTGKSKGSTAVSTEAKGGGPTTIRFVSADVAVEDGNFEVSGDRQRRGYFTAIWVKRDGRWRLDSLREAATPAASGDAALAGLDWFVGNWVSRNDGVTTHASFAWSDNRRFLLGRFSLQTPDGVAVTASQRIGWDPSSRQLKSWFFDSDGSFGEADWTSDGKQWTARSTQTSPDGTKTTSVISYARDGDDAFQWKSTDAATGKERSVRFSREPAGE